MNIRSIILLIVVILFSTSVIATDFLTTYNPFTGQLDYYTLDGSSTNTSTNTSLDDLNVTNLLVINAPVECPAGTYMTYTNMSESVCMEITGGSIAVNGTFITVDPYVDVRAYGAVCDGSGDDWAAIQRALNHTSGNTDIMIFGSCMISRPLEYTKARKFYGSSSRSTYISATAGFTGCYMMQNWRMSDYNATETDYCKPPSSIAELNRYPKISDIFFIASRVQNLNILGFYTANEGAKLENLLFINLQNATPITLINSQEVIINNIVSYGGNLSSELKYYHDSFATRYGAVDISDWVVSPGSPSSHNFYFENVTDVSMKNIHIESHPNSLIENLANIYLKNVIGFTLQDSYTSVSVGGMNTTFLWAVHDDLPGSYLNESPTIENLYIHDPDKFLGPFIIDEMEDYREIWVRDSVNRISFINHYDGNTFSWKNGNTQRNRVEFFSLIQPPFVISPRAETDKSNYSASEIVFERGSTGEGNPSQGKTYVGRFLRNGSAASGNNYFSYMGSEAQHVPNRDEFNYTQGNRYVKPAVLTLSPGGFNILTATGTPTEHESEVQLTERFLVDNSGDVFVKTGDLTTEEDIIANGVTRYGTSCMWHNGTAMRIENVCTV